MSAAQLMDRGELDSAEGGLLGEQEAERLATRIQAHAAHVAEAVCRLLVLVGEFDAGEGTRWYVGVKSTAHWLSWACSMAPGPAREHVRVARALRQMPATVVEFSAGRLSYSKVREMTRVVGLIEEEALIEMARAMTASQLARTISGFRVAAGTRMSQEARREASWRVRDDGMIEIRAVLPAETGAEVATALDLALAHEELADEGGEPGPLLEQRMADAVVEVARAALDAAPQDRSGQDRHLVLVHATPDMLTADGETQDESAGDPVPPRDMTDELPDDVPAGTPDAPHDRCGIVGMGPLEPRTVQRLACTGALALLVTDDAGEVLHLGRARRLASQAQRRALRATQETCQFPSCHQSRHLDAHHMAPWSSGGDTDIENLVLLCRRHHVLVHEGGLRIRHARPVAGAGSALRFEVVDGAGRPVQARWPEILEHALISPLEPEHPMAIEDTGEPRYLWGEGDTRIAPTTGGFGFRLDDAVSALCRSATGADGREDLEFVDDVSDPVDRG